MYIAGSNDDIQGGICMGGIAHAGPVRYTRIAWFNKTCKVSYANPIQSLPSWSMLARIFPMNYQARFFSSRTVSTGVDCHFHNSSDLLRLTSLSDSKLTTAPMSLSTLATAAWVYTGTHGIVYVNGSAGDPPVAMTITGMTATLDLGYYSSSNFALLGTLFDIVVFSRALSAEEMLNPYQVQDSRIFAVPGHGITAADWTDAIGGLTPTITGTLSLRYLRGDGVVITP